MFTERTLTQVQDMLYLNVFLIFILVNSPNSYAKRE